MKSNNFGINTNVWTGTSYKNFEELVRTEKTFLIESYDVEVNGFVLGKATIEQVKTDNKTMKVIYGTKSKNYEVICTPESQFMLNDKTWASVNELLIGMQLMYNNDGLNPTEFFVKEVIFNNEPTVLCTLTVIDTDNFLIDGGIVVK